MDEFNAAHGVQKAATPRALKRAAAVAATSASTTS